jgi:hypothetical protein
MFESVNEIAVVGATFFMMAAGTVWYSPMFFGNAWLRELRVSDTDIENTKQHMWRQLLITFVTYGAMLMIIAKVNTFAPEVGISVAEASFALAAFVALLFFATVQWEQKSMKYYLISTGFYSFFIIAGSFIIDYWPW